MAWKTAKWTESQDAYGSASVVPGLIETALAADVGDAEVAIEQLRERLCHQGHNTPAALLAAPFLPDIFEAASPSTKPMLALLVADIASGGDHVSALWSRSENAPTNVQALVEGVRQPLQSAFDELPAARAACGVALATLAPQSATQEALAQWAANEVEPNSRATALLCVAATSHLTPTASAPTSKADDPIVIQAARYVAALAVYRHELTEEGILDGLAILEELPGVTECGWAGGDLRQLVIWAMTRAIGSSGDAVGEALLDLVEGGPLANAVACALLQSRVPRWNGPRLRTLAELGDDERKLIEQLFDRNLLGPQAREVIRRAGVFEQLAWLKRLLGRVTGPLDAECWPGEPWWRAINDVVNGRLAVSKLAIEVERLTIDDVIGLVEDSLVDYPVSRPWPPLNTKPPKSVASNAFDKLIQVLGELFRATKADDRSLLELIRTRTSQFPDWRVAAAVAVRDRSLVRQDAEIVKKLRALEPYEGVGPAVRRLLDA